MATLSEIQLLILEKETVSCDDVLTVMGEYADNELSATVRARVDAHLRQCRGCRELRDSYLLTIDLASELREAPLPEGVSERLRTGLSQKLGIALSGERLSHRH